MEKEFNFESLLTRKEIYATIETSDKEHPVLIFSPNTKQRKLILNLIISNLKSDKDKIKTDLSGYDVVFTLLDELTNVKLGLDINNPEHRDRVQQIIEDPSDIFLDINSHLIKIVNKQFYRYYDSLKELSQMPEELREAYIESIDKIVKENEENHSKGNEKAKEIEELKLKLKQLEEGV